jgi:hypothetical protein
MTDTKPNTFWDAIADGRPDHLSWILNNVIRTRYHNCGDILEVAVSQPHFLFKLAYGELRIKFQNGSFYLSETMGKNSKTFCKAKFERTDAHCHLQLVFLNIQC